MKNLKPSKKAATVIIFSSPIKKDSIRNRNISVENFSWPLLTTESEKIGNNIVEEIYNTYKKLDVTKSLRIICIDALGSKGELSGEKANEILTLFTSSIKKSGKSPPFDVIILPKFYMHNGKDAREIMKSLWHLRKYAVLISSSSLHAKLPSTEVIAVEGATEYHKPQESVLDFVVVGGKPESKQDPTPGSSKLEGSPEKEKLMSEGHNDWHDGSLVQSLAPAVVSAIALKILDCLQADHNANISG